MLVELVVRNFGVVEDVSLVWTPGMTAITGETGAGKTLLTEAIRLLVGGRAEPHMVRDGATEAWLEGRFSVGDDEQVIARAIPVEGRSRAYVGGRMVPISALTEAGEKLVAIYGQNGHQALANTVSQRRGLDNFAGTDVEELSESRSRLAQIESDISKLGGDSQSRAREIDLLRFQLEELEDAGIVDQDEETRLWSEEQALAGAAAHRQSAGAVHAALAGDSGVTDRLAEAIQDAGDQSPLAEIQNRLRDLAVQIDDVSRDASVLAEQLQEDPERLAHVQERRAALKQLQRKYGPTLQDVIDYNESTRGHLEELERHDEVLSDLERQRESAIEKLAVIEQRVEHQRRKGAPELAAGVEGHLKDLALPNARFEVEVEGRAGDNVTFMFGPNPGMPLLPLSKAASGGELARTMLALRLTLMENEASETGPATLIFDEVDAGVGGVAATAVGQALATLASGDYSDCDAGSEAHLGDRQVLVVTHLPQVAAFADRQILVDKAQLEDSTKVTVKTLDDGEREIELARMLSGRPESESGREHARELLDAAISSRPQESGPVRRQERGSKPQSGSGKKSRRSDTADNS